MPKVNFFSKIHPRPRSTFEAAGDRGHDGLSRPLGAAAELAGDGAGLSDQLGAGIRPQILLKRLLLNLRRFLRALIAHTVLAGTLVPSADRVVLGKC